MPRGRGRALAGLLFLLTVTSWPPGQTDAQTTSTLVLSAQVHGRTKLVVSAHALRFAVTSPDRPALATLDFIAAARTRRGGDVVLTVEALGAVRGPGGATDVGAELWFTGDGPGTLSGALDRAGPVAACRWVGSGQRAGRLWFSLRTGVEGNYAVPVHLVLSTP